MRATAPRTPRNAPRGVRFGGNTGSVMMSSPMGGLGMSPGSMFERRTLSGTIFDGGSLGPLGDTVVVTDPTTGQQKVVVQASSSTAGQAGGGKPRTLPSGTVVHEHVLRGLTAQETKDYNSALTILAQLMRLNSWKEEGWATATSDTKAKAISTPVSGLHVYFEQSKDGGKTWKTLYGGGETVAEIFSRLRSGGQFKSYLANTGEVITITTGKIPAARITGEFHPQYVLEIPGKVAQMVGAVLGPILEALKDVVCIAVNDPLVSQAVAAGGGTPAQIAQTLGKSLCGPAPGNDYQQLEADNTMLYAVGGAAFLAFLLLR